MFFKNKQDSNDILKALDILESYVKEDINKIEKVDNTCSATEKLIMEKILEGDGVELINKVLYYKLEWANNESSFSIDNKLSYFKALLYFGADLKNLANRYSNRTTNDLIFYLDR